MWRVQFAHPAMLYLAAAAAIPLVIHLLRRHRVQVVRFPAVQFLRVTTKRCLVKTNLKHLLLLLLRMFLIALLALVLARPIVGRGTGAPGAAPTGGSRPASSLSVVIVLDDSLSMNYRRGGVSWFERARNQALEILAHLPADAEAAVTSTSQPAVRFSRDPPKLRARLTGLRPTLEGNSCRAALQQAGEALRNRPAAARAVCLVTDLTRAAWRDLSASDDTVDLGDKVALEVVVAREGRVENVALTDVVHEGEPLLEGALLKVGADVLSVGRGADEMVQLELDGRVVDRQRAVVSADGTAHLVLTALLETAGHHSGKVALLNPDGLPYDDSRAFALYAPEAVSVLVVDDSIGRGMQGLPGDAATRSYFFRSALAPWGSRRGIFRVSAVRPERLEERGLADFDLVALVDVPALGRGTWRRLEDFVAGGGALLVSFGAGSGGAASAAEHARDLLPALPGEVVAAPDFPEGAMSMRAVQVRHPLVAALAAAGADVGRARFSACRQLGLSETAQEVFSFGPGLPALALGAAGGRVVVLAGGLDTQWGDFPRLRDFVPFCQELALYLTGAADGRLVAYQVGQHVPIRFRPSSWPTIVAVFPPGSDEGIPAMPGTTPGRQLFWQTGEPGYYRVEFSRQDEHWIEGFGINTDPAESDLRRVAPEVVRAGVRAARVLVHEDGSTLALPGGGGKGGGWGRVEVTLYLVALGLLTWTAEAFLANRIYRSAPAETEASAGRT